MLYGWEGNRRSGVALAVRHRLSGLSICEIKGKCAGDVHPMYAACYHVINIGVGAQSTLGGKIFLPEKYVWKINKMPEFYMILAEIIEIPEFL